MVEKMNHTAYKMIVKLLDSTRIPDSMWSWVVDGAANLINRTPHSRTGEIPLREHLGRPPTYRLLPGDPVWFYDSHPVEGALTHPSNVYAGTFLGFKHKGACIIVRRINFQKDVFTVGIYHPSVVKAVKYTALEEPYKIRERLESPHYERVQIEPPKLDVQRLMVTEQAYAQKLAAIRREIQSSQSAATVNLDAEIIELDDELTQVDKVLQEIPPRDERLKSRSEHKRQAKSFKAQLMVLCKPTPGKAGKPAPKHKAKQLKVGDVDVQAPPEWLRQGKWIEADKKELFNWFELGAIESEPIQPEDVASLGIKPITLRWIRTRKFKNGLTIFKSRIVAQGFKDERQLSKAENFIGLPTAAARRLIHIAGLSRGWKMRTADITTAYLQAKSKSDTPLYVKFPHDKYHQMTKESSKDPWIFQPGAVHKVIKAVYGLSDSAKTFILHLQDELTEHL